MSGEFPVIQSKHSLVAKHVTKERWDKVKDIKTKTCGFTIAKACACAIEFDNQHCGIYAGDWDCYKASLRSLMLLSKTTMESNLMPSTPLTWMLPRSLETLIKMSQFTPPVSVLDVALMDMVFPPESPSNSVLMLRS
eukprot:TRINITY_DN20_c0_g1_i10.p1 TRINITY_DN20_c0_g1~~TRINITY_DN20_c0_g1_i10.p1  ORF type:complete len:137 (-),score=31.53 TRINITY_DN20_c0_g1_i10:26-436(-)